MNTKYSCRHPGCFGMARYMAKSNIPIHGHLCSACYADLTDSMQAQYAPIINLVDRQKFLSPNTTRIINVTVDFGEIEIPPSQGPIPPIDLMSASKAAFWSQMEVPLESLNPIALCDAPAMDYNVVITRSVAVGGFANANVLLNDTRNAHSPFWLGGIGETKFYDRQETYLVGLRRPSMSHPQSYPPIGEVYIHTSPSKYFRGKKLIIEPLDGYLTDLIQVDSCVAANLKLILGSGATFPAKLLSKQISPETTWPTLGPENKIKLRLQNWNSYPIRVHAYVEGLGVDGQIP